MCPSETPASFGGAVCARRAAADAARRHRVRMGVTLSHPSRKSEDEDGVGTAGWCDFRGFSQKASVQQPVARHDRHVLLTVHGVRNGANRNVSAHDPFPKLLTGIGVEGAEAAIHVAMKYQVARGGEHGAVARGAPFVEAQDLAGGEIDLCDAGEL